VLDSKNVSQELMQEKEELEQLKSKMQNNTQTMTASFSGLISYSVNVQDIGINEENMMDLTPESIENLKKQEQRNSTIASKTEITVSEGQAFGRLVMNDEAWFAFVISENDADMLIEKNTEMKNQSKKQLVDISLDGVTDVINMEIIKISELQNGKYVVIAHMNKEIEKTLDQTTISGKLMVLNLNGLKVPVRSLFNINSVDNTADIMVVKMGKTVIRRVVIVGSQNAYAIIENIENINAEEKVNVFDVFIINPSLVKEGQAITS
jgi:hypothetical protein